MLIKTDSRVISFCLGCGQQDYLRSAPKPFHDRSLRPSAALRQHPIIPAPEQKAGRARVGAQMQLARRGSVCLIAGVMVQPGRTLSSSNRVPISALGGLLALLLLVATTFSVSHALHQSLHHDGAGSGHLCLACSFAKGQVGVAALGLFVAVLVFCCLRGVCPVGVSPSSGRDYRVSLSRAPPLP